MTSVISGIKIPDSKLAREAAELVRSYEDEMLFNHSVRVYVFGAMKGLRQNLKFDSELLYVAALFHDLGLVDHYHTQTKRFGSTGRMLRAISSGRAALPSRKPILCGRQSRCTPRPGFRNICGRKSRSPTRAF